MRYCDYFSPHSLAMGLRFNAGVVYKCVWENIMSTFSIMRERMKFYVIFNEVG